MPARPRGRTKASGKRCAFEHTSIAKNRSVTPFFRDHFQTGIDHAILVGPRRRKLIRVRQKGSKFSAKIVDSPGRFVTMGGSRDETSRDAKPEGFAPQSSLTVCTGDLCGRLAGGRKFIDARRPNL